MTDGWHCQTCNALITDSAVRYHYQAVHQPISFIRLPGSAARVRIDRDPNTGRFTCPRIGCSVSFELGQEVQSHARHCTKPLDVYKEEEKPTLRKRALSTSQSAFEPRKTVHRSIHIHGHTSASARYPAKRNAPSSSSRQDSLSARASLSTRTLRVHTANLPQTTRTQRALIRHCFNGKSMMVSEIAEWVGVDRDTVWSVVRNEDADDLSEDRLYLDGKRGEIIDVDAIKFLRPFIKGEPVDDDRWLRFNASISDDEYDSEEEIERQYIQASPVVPPRRHRRDSSGSIESMSSLTSLGDEDAPGDPEDMFEEFRESSPGPEPSPSTASPPVSSTVYSNTASHSPLRTRVKLDDTVETFVRSLGGPSDQLVRIFCDTEIDTEERLNWLCLQEEDYWNDVKDYMLRKGVKLFHWLVVKKGLRDRAAALASAGTEIKA